MSGEPKTLTLTFQEAVELLGRDYRCALVFLPDSPDQRGDYWSTLSIDEEGYAVEDFAPTWEETMSAALGVPVVARDEAAELRAAAAEWAEADHASREAHKAWLSEAAKGGASYTGDKAISRNRKRWAESLPSYHAYRKASAERHAAKERLEALARRLAGGESER